MSRQLTIFCSVDLDERVVGALDRAGLEGFVYLEGATGNKFAAPGRVPRSLTWEASMFVVPAAAPERVQQVVDELRHYADACATDPCLRITVSEVAEVY